MREWIKLQPGLIDKKTLFRRKEVAARKKSEETQDLASDAHRNLEHALPSLEAAMQAINAIDKSDIMEVRKYTS